MLANDISPWINWLGSTLYIFSERPVFSSLWSHDHCLNSLFQKKYVFAESCYVVSSVSVCVIFFPLQKGGKSSSLRLIITPLTKVPVALPRLMRESFYFPSLIYCLFILLHMLLDFSLQIYETFIPITFRCFLFWVFLYIELDLSSFKLQTQIQLFSDADYFWTFWTHFKCFKAVIL